MNKQAIKDILYGGMHELMQNPTFYRASISARLSYFTEEGKEALFKLMLDQSVNILEIERQTLEKKAKEMVLTTLKGENS